ncbi:hypothetical protein D9O29_06210 [Pantoea vagans]|nr:hypothetical protein D9O29_06210 [Pantoea vagans]
MIFSLLTIMSLQLRLYKLSELCRRSHTILIFFQHNHYDNQFHMLAYCLIRQYFITFAVCSYLMLASKTTYSLSLSAWNYFSLHRNSMTPTRVLTHI